MSLESDIASVLRNDPSGRINFKVETVAVNKAQMESVAKAIDTKDITIKIGDTGAQLGAAYSSWKGRRLDPGEKKIIGMITVSGANVTSNSMGKAAVFHESVHAMIDIKDARISMHNDEVVAYLADAMYLRATKTSVSGGPLEKAIYDAAFALVDGNQMLTKHGVTLKWTDCDALRDAIKAHPAYH